MLVLTIVAAAGRCPAAEPAAGAIARSKQTAPATDPTIDEAAKLKIKIPMMCREWHVWWGSPHGIRPLAPAWIHWDGLKRFGQFDPTTTIEEAVPGLAWRRYLNSVGYPLLGPYDPSQPDIIRWQLETARNAGLACLHLHVWPSIRDEGSDFSPLPIVERVLATAAELGYPVGIHDEVMFRSAEISQAQVLSNSIRRLSTLVKCYGAHPGWYKIDGMPVLYFQNWNKWISAKDMRTLFAEVEKRSQPVYWMVEMAPEDEYLEIPQLRAYFGPSNSWFLYTPPYGKQPHPWEKAEDGVRYASDKARKHGKKVGALVFSRFNNNNDRGVDGRERIDADDGRFYVESLRRAAAMKPDFIVATQWNDFEESAFLEPAWDCDGWNGDPYRYCRITAAAVNKSFKPAALPKREQVDPWIRHKLFGDSQSGDLGPVLYSSAIEQNKLHWKWADGSGDPASLRFVQQRLARWSVENPNGASLRLANALAAEGLGTLRGGQELRFFAPPLAGDRPTTVWLGARVAGAAAAGLRVNYRSESENYHWDSHWDRRHATLGKTPRIRLDDGDDVYWTPLHGAQFYGSEGDLTLRLEGADGPCAIKDVFLWRPDMQGADIRVTWQDQSTTLPDSIVQRGPLVVVAYDKLDNAGLPRLFYDGKTLPPPSRDPMDLLTK
jgi:hypothetical protein